MKKIYACLLGNWVCLNDDPNCVIGNNRQDPYIWWEEGASVYSPIVKNTKYENSLLGFDYVNIHYKNKDYRINPIFIQIVTD